MCENRVNTHSHRAYFTNYFLNIKALASRSKRKSFIYSSEVQRCFYAVNILAIPYCIIFAAVHSLHLHTHAIVRHIRAERLHVFL